MQLWDYLPEEAPMVVAYILVSTALFLFNCKARSPTVKSLAYFPILQCKPIYVLQANIGLEGVEMDRNWAIFTEENSVADVAFFPFLAEIQPVLLFDHGKEPCAMELRYGSRSLEFALSPLSDPQIPFSYGGVSSAYISESLNVSRWLSDLFQERLLLGHIMRNSETTEALQPILASTASRHQCEGRCTVRLLGHIVVEHRDYEEEQQWMEFSIGSVVLRRKSDRGTIDWMPAATNRSWSGHTVVQCEVVTGGVIHLEDALEVTQRSDTPFWQ